MKHRYSYCLNDSCCVLVLLADIMSFVKTRVSDSASATLCKYYKEIVSFYNTVSLWEHTVGQELK